jgi:hypothetical protein
MSLQNKIMSANFRNKLSLLRKLASQVMVDKETDEIDIYNQLTKINN